MTVGLLFSFVPRLMGRTWTYQGGKPVKFYEARATINATPDRIWKLLTDAPAYPGWNPSVERIEGRIAPGETIKVIVKVNPGRAFPVKVVDFQPGKRMVWSGGMPLGLFRGERTYTMEPAGDAATRFAMREEYTGPLLAMIWKSIPRPGTLV